MPRFSHAAEVWPASFQIPCVAADLDSTGVASKPNTCIMYTSFTSLVGLAVLAVMAEAAADYPSTPADLSTPVQQRLAISGMNCKILPVKAEVRT